MADKNLKLKKKIDITKSYSPADEEEKVWTQYKARKKELMESRRSVLGLNIDQKMIDWDTNYFNRVADIPPSELDAESQPIAINNAFGKIQAALALLIDRSPGFTLDPNLEKYRATTQLNRALAEKSWQRTNSLEQFRLFVFNMAKRGYGVGRTFHRLLENDARFRTGEDEKGKPIYEKHTVTKMDDVGFINLDNHNVWIDEEARPGDMLSIRDWAWREVWHIDKVRKIFPESEFPNMEFVGEGGVTTERIDAATANPTSPTVSAQSRETKTGMTELFFYEHQYDDWFIVEINGVMVVWEPLPQDHKRISLVTAQWHTRSAETIYGIGVIEEMETDEKFIDRILNASLRQLIMSINPPGFYSGTEDFENENIKLKAGVLRRTMNPQDIKFVEIPEMKRAGIDMIEWMERKQDDRTGITDVLEGNTEERKGEDTAFEINANREAGLRRLKLPLKHLQPAFDWELRNRIDLIRQVYSQFDVEHLANEEDIMEYLEEVNADPQFYFIQNEGQPGQERFFKNKFRETSLDLEQGEDGVFTETQEKAFFKILPQWLSWEGDVSVDFSRMLVTSEDVDRVDTLRMTNLLVPLFQIPREIAEKPVRQILKAFKKDITKWLPDAWLEKQQPEEGEAGQVPGQPETPSNVQNLFDNQTPDLQKPDTVIPERDLEVKRSITDRLKGIFKR